MASFDRGTKRQCLHCGTKFYDLNRDPIVCPGCSKTFIVQVAPADKGPAKPAKQPAGTEEVIREPAAAKAGAEIISLDEADEEDTNEGEDIPDVEDVEDVKDNDNSGEQSFLESDDDDDDLDIPAATGVNEDI